MLRVGIVGLPNAGKSTLFNALTRSHQATVAGYPFCTIDPNVGVIAVPEPRLAPLAAFYHSHEAFPTAVEFFDIAGLVRGASHGEGLGNQFLAHIRQTDALVEVVRAFADPNVAHVEAGLDPLRDVETIRTELLLADLGTVDRRREATRHRLRVGDKTAQRELACLDRIAAALDAGTPARALALHDDERAVMAELFLLTAKPILYAVNVGEDGIGRDGAALALREDAAREGATVVELCADLEAQLVDLAPDEAAEYLASAGLAGRGTDGLIRAAHRLLRLLTFFTCNEKEARARSLPEGSTAVEAAGSVHTDFARGFIAAEVIGCAELLAQGSLHKAREHGLIRLEGRSYVVREGDVLQFRFHA
jgi:ribosome-binding ATPase